MPSPATKLVNVGSGCEDFASGFRGPAPMRTPPFSVVPPDMGPTLPTLPVLGVIILEPPVEPNPVMGLGDPNAAMPPTGPPMGPAIG